MMVWDVGDFGNAVPAKGNDAPLCNFIPCAVAQQQADILMLQEVRQAGFALLGQLNNALRTATNGDWYHDCIPGALSVTPPANGST
jgi:hypothetical protein